MFFFFNTSNLLLKYSKWQLMLFLLLLLVYFPFLDTSDYKSIIESIIEEKSPIEEAGIASAIATVETGMQCTRKILIKFIKYKHSSLWRWHFRGNQKMSLSQLLSSSTDRTRNERIRFRHILWNWELWELGTLESQSSNSECVLNTSDLCYQLLHEYGKALSFSQYYPAILFCVT